MVAYGGNYTTIDKVKARLNVAASDTSDDAVLTDAVESASREVEQYTHRVFGTSTTATTRKFLPLTNRLSLVDDFHTTVDLVIALDTTKDGTADRTLTTDEYQLEPLDGLFLGVAWPFWRIRMVDSIKFPEPKFGRATVHVTAKWGWASVPQPVEEATVQLAVETYKLKDSPFGVANWGEFGPMRVRDNPKATKLLRQYRRDGIYTP